MNKKHRKLKRMTALLTKMQVSHFLCFGKWNTCYIKRKGKLPGSQGCGWV